MIGSRASWYWYLFWWELGAGFCWRWLVGRLVCAWIGHDDEYALCLRPRPDRGPSFDTWFMPDQSTVVCSRCGRWEYEE